MFELIYSLRRSSMLRLAVLILGFALFGMTLTIVIASGKQVNQMQPSWVQSGAPFATLGVIGQDGELSPSSLQRLQAHRNIPNVVDLATIGVQTNATIRFGEHEQQVTTALLSDNFAAMLNIAPMIQDTNQWPSIAYISHDFWLEHYGGRDINEEHIVLSGAANTAIKIAGVLPPEFASLLLQQPQVWLSNTHATTLLNVDFGENGPPPHIVQSIKQQISMENTIHYGILQLNQGMTDTNKLLLQTDNAAADKSFIHTDTKFNQLQATSGIEFKPKAKEKQILQWQILLLLAIALGLVNGLNLLTSTISDLIQRQQELSVRIAVGATPQAILKTLFIGQLPLITASFLLMLLVLPTLLSYMQQHEYLLANLVSANLHTGVAATLFIYVVVTTIILILAMASQHSNIHFNRAKGQHASKIQQMLSSLTICCQCLIALFGVYFSVALLTNQWQKFNQLPFADDINELAILSPPKSTNKGIDITDLMAKVPRASAVSNQSFVMPSTVSVQLYSSQMAEREKVAINFASVTDDYFSLLNATWLSGNGFKAQSFVLNLAAAKRLAPQKPLSLLGQRLNSNQTAVLGLDDKEKIEITGIIDNLPHFGIYDTDLPMIYGNLLATPKDRPRQLYVLMEKTQVDMLQQTLLDVMKTNGNFVVKNNGSLKLQLSDKSKLTSQLINTVLVLAVVVCILTMTTLFGQLNSYLTLMQNQFAVFLAVGAQPHNIISTIALKLTTLLGIASILFTIVTLWLSPNTTLNQLTGSVNITNITLSILIMLFIAILSSAIPCWQLIKQPVANLLDKV